MPRQGRINIAGGIYHVIQRGIERKAIFNDDADREEFVRRLREGLEKTGHQCYGWVLMPNHFHLLLRTGVRSLSDLMRKLLTGYALYFNKKYQRSGYLYQNRYKSILCQEESYLLELVRYIHLNPLRAKIVKDIKGLEKYKWSGHGVLLGTNKAEWQDSREILERFGNKKKEAIKKYKEFVNEAKSQGKREELSGGGMIRSVGGWRELLGLRKSGQKWAGDERILGDSDFVNNVLKESAEELTKKERLKREGWNLKKLVKRACELIGVNEEEIKRHSKRSPLSQARSLVIYWGYAELGISGVEIAKHFGITKASVSEAVNRGRQIANEHQYLIT